MVVLPAELQQALDKNRAAEIVFEQLAPGRKKAIVLSITEAKTEATKIKRIAKAMDELTR
jgi:uncharacterized protein YdeI (YjbR/CyaY-like superfamily)